MRRPRVSDQIASTSCPSARNACIVRTSVPAAPRFGSAGVSDIMSTLKVERIGGSSPARTLSCVAHQEVAMSHVRAALDLLRSLTAHPIRSGRQMGRVPDAFRAAQFCESWPASAPETIDDSEPNPLRAFFDARTEGRGIWKWLHYFDI